MKKVMGLVIGLVPVSVSAECVPSPDCASIGYTETSWFEKYKIKKRSLKLRFFEAT